MSEKKEYLLPDGAMYMTDEELEIMRQNFFNKYPDCPTAEVVECLEIDVSKEIYDEIKSGKRRATFFLDDNPLYHSIYDTKVLEYRRKMDKKRDEYFGNWSPLFCNGRKTIKSIKYFCGDESTQVFIKEQGWAISNVTDVDERMKNDYGCPELYDYIEECWSPDKWEQRHAQGESYDSIYSEESPEFHYFIFQ